jgi:glutathione S-transferase
MITLCGFAISNYYNKVKMVLLEKGLAFEEEVCKTGSKDEAVLASSPLAKIPFIRTEHGALCESQAIVDYIEALHPQPALMPADPWQAAKVRELITFVELHLELVARELYPQAFFGSEAKLSEADLARIRKKLEKNIAGFKRLAKFSPYVAGASFTQADCVAWCSLPLVSMATRIVYAEDLLAAGGIEWKPYSRMIGERPSAQRVLADRKAAQEGVAVPARRG